MLNAKPEWHGIQINKEMHVIQNGKKFHEISQARPVIQMFNFHFYARLISLFAISTYHLVTSDRTLYTAHQKHPPPRPHVSSRIHTHPQKPELILLAVHL